MHCKPRLEHHQPLRIRKATGRHLHRDRISAGIEERPRRPLVTGFGGPPTRTFNPLPIGEHPVDRRRHPGGAAILRHARRPSLRAHHRGAKHGEFGEGSADTDQKDGICDGRALRQAVRVGVLHPDGVHEYFHCSSLFLRYRRGCTRSRRSLVIPSRCPPPVPGQATARPASR
jgi:hypothetical protein